MLKKFIKFFEKKIEKKDELGPIKKKLADELIDSIPPDFTDCIGSQDLMENPVMTEFGHVFEQNSIQEWVKDNDTCPLTRAELTVKTFTVIPELKTVLDCYNTNLQHLLKEISQMQSPQEEKAFTKKIENFISSNEVFLEWFEAEKQKAMIRMFKDAHKLDISKGAHLKHWDEKPSLCTLGLKNVKVEGHSYYLTPIVYNVLKAAAKPYNKSADFHREIVLAQKEKLDCWANFWGNTPYAREMQRIKLEKPLAPGLTK